MQVFGEYFWWDYPPKKLVGFVGSVLDFFNQMWGCYHGVCKLESFYDTILMCF